MNHSSIEAFLAIVSTKSISKAAELLFMSQSAVSLQLKALEEELGVTLIERQKGHRNVEVTQKGKDFILIAKGFVQLHKVAKAFKHETKKNITISSVDSLSLFTFSSFYQQLVFGDDLMNLSIITHQSPEIYELVDNRIVDVGLVLMKTYMRSITVRPIFREKMAFVSLAGNHINERVSGIIHPKDLNYEKEVLLTWSPEFSQWHDSWCRPNHYPKIQVDTISMLMQFLHDDYWAIIPVSIIKILQKSYPVQMLMLDEEPPDRICYILTNKYQKQLQASGIKVFEERLEKYLQENYESLNITLL